MPYVEPARRLRITLYQDAQLVPQRVLADRSLNFCEAAHLLIIDRKDQFSAFDTGARQLASRLGRLEDETGWFGCGRSCVAPRCG